MVGSLYQPPPPSLPVAATAATLLATLVGWLVGPLGYVGFVLAWFIELVVIFVLSESAPKTWAVQRTERAALLSAPLIAAIAANWARDLAYQVHALIVMAVAAGLFVWTVRQTGEARPAGPRRRPRRTPPRCRATGIRGRGPPRCRAARTPPAATVASRTARARTPRCRRARSSRRTRTRRCPPR